MKSSIIAVFALASVVAFAQPQSTPQTPTKAAALATVEQGEKTLAQLNAQARSLSKKIGELALSADLSTNTAAMEELKKLVATLDETNARLAALEESIAELKEWAAGKDKTDVAIVKAMDNVDKIKFSNYFQFQFRDTDQAGKEQHSFEVRRVRLGATYEINPEASAKISFDMAAGTNRSGAELKDAMFIYKPKGSKGLAFTAGQFVSPLGYETPTSSSALEFPERVTYNKTLFNDERLRGVMVDQALEGGVSLFAGVVNALATKDAEQASIAPGAGARTAGFAGLRFKSGNDSYGIGYFTGKRPEYTSGGTSPEVDRNFLFVDAQLNNIANTGLYFRGELMTGKDRVPKSTGNPLNVATDMTGYVTVFGYKLNGENELFARYSVFDSDTDVDGDAISELGFGWRHTLGAGATFSLTHETFRDASVSNSPYGVMTARLQFKF